MEYEAKNSNRCGERLGILAQLREVGHIQGLQDFQHFAGRVLQFQALRFWACQVRPHQWELSRDDTCRGHLWLCRS